jgi:hypothetical protein
MKARSTSSSLSWTATAWSINGGGPSALSGPWAARAQLGAYGREPEAAQGRGAARWPRPAVVSHPPEQHHRWSLDQSQIYQYHLAGALHPHVRWWEAMRYRPGRCSSCLSARRSRSSRSCARTWPNRRARRRHPGGRPHRRLRGLARRTAAGIAVGGPVCERARRRPRIGRTHADLVRDGAAQPASGARGLSDRRVVEGRRPGVPRDSARAGRMRCS